MKILQTLWAFVILALMQAAFAQPPDTSTDLPDEPTSQENPVTTSVEAFRIDENGNYIESTTAYPGERVEYRITATNTDLTTLPAESVSIFGPVPTDSTFVIDSASSPEWALLEYSSDSVNFDEVITSEVRALRWTLLEPFEPNMQVLLTYQVIIGGSTTPNPYSGDINCDDVTDAEAQAILEANPSDPNNLDADNDGDACEPGY